jgi:tetratricopeptide (TPR) repeat protein
VSYFIEDDEIDEMGSPLPRPDSEDEDPDLYLSWRRLSLLDEADAALERGESEEALARYTAATEVIWHDDLSWLCLARAAVKHGRRELALSALERCVALNPGNALALRDGDEPDFDELKAEARVQKLLEMAPI